MGRVLARLARIFVIIGGICLTVAGLLTVVSVMGRYFINSPIPGDFELVEMACAVAVFSFLPYCQLRKGNVLVDFLPIRLRPAKVFWTRPVLIYGLITVLLTWRLWVGGFDFLDTNEQTIILQIPRAYVFVFIMPSMVLLVLVTFYTIWQHYYSNSAEQDGLEGKM